MDPILGPVFGPKKGSKTRPFFYRKICVRLQELQTAISELRFRKFAKDPSLIQIPDMAWSRVPFELAAFGKCKRTPTGLLPRNLAWTLIELCVQCCLGVHILNRRTRARNLAQFTECNWHRQGTSHGRGPSRCPWKLGLAWGPEMGPWCLTKI